MASISPLIVACRLFDPALPDGPEIAAVPASNPASSERNCCGLGRTVFGVPKRNRAVEFAEALIAACVWVATVSAVGGSATCAAL